jgi:hypothetical protein
MRMRLQLRTVQETAMPVPMGGHGRHSGRYWTFMKRKDKLSMDAEILQFPIRGQFAGSFGYIVEVQGCKNCDNGWTIC